MCRGKLQSHFGENGIEIIVNGYHLSFAITPKFEKRLSFDGRKALVIKIAFKYLSVLQKLFPIHCKTKKP